VKIGFVGLGKLGLPIALASGARGHDVFAWDTDPSVRENVQSARFPHREAGGQALLERSNLRLAPLETLVAASEIVFVTVQTPHEAALEGSTPLPAYRRDFDYSYLAAAVGSVISAVGTRDGPLTLAVMSTVLPGTLEREVKPLLKPGVSLAYNPSFTAMGTTIADFLEPEFVLIGVDPPRPAGDGLPLARFYQTIHDRPLFQTDVKTAELIKVAYNTFIGQKIVFANAMMEISHKLGANVDDLASALALATDRVTSARYLAGGMGDGGACHPRDNIALSWLSQQLEVSHDIFDDVMRAREDQTRWLADLIVERAGDRPIVILGKAFKAESALVDGSPALLLASLLAQRGIGFSHYDGHVDGGPPLPGPSEPAVFFVATRHDAYRELAFPSGSIVLDPWGYIPDQDGVTVARIGRP
jgi:UDPglucose 6-dehydrogenase